MAKSRAAQGARVQRELSERLCRKTMTTLFHATALCMPTVLPETTTVEVAVAKLLFYKRKAFVYTIRSEKQPHFEHTKL